MVKHSPAPWTLYVKKGTPLSIESASQLADVCSFLVPPTRADADLMVAAPDLLETLQTVADKLDEFADAEDLPVNLLQDVNAAIAKAVGESMKGERRA